MSSTVTQVEKTSHISFDSVDKTFRLYTSNSIYAFSISPELVLEHLHWGESIPPGYDLRYLCQSSRNTHFNVVEAAPDRFGGKIVLEAETLEEIQSTWRENRVWAPKDMDDLERFQRRRLENYSWRIMSKISIHDCQHAFAMIQDRNYRDNRQQRFPLKSLPSSADLNTFAKSNHIGKSHIETESLQQDHKLVKQLKVDLRKTLKAAPSEANLIFMKEKAFAKPLDPASIHYKHPMLENLISKVGQKHKHTQTFNRAIGKVGKGGLCVEYADHGTGDFRTPSFLIVDNFNGSSISPLRYRRHRIYKGKLEMPDGLPSIRCIGEEDASTLVVTLADVISGVEVDLIYGEYSMINSCQIHLLKHFVFASIFLSDHASS